LFPAMGWERTLNRLLSEPWVLLDQFRDPQRSFLQRNHIQECLWVANLILMIAGRSLDSILRIAWLLHRGSPLLLWQLCRSRLPPEIGAHFISSLCWDPYRQTAESFPAVSPTRQTNRTDSLGSPWCWLDWQSRVFK
jgi:hypothetical protein